MTQRNGKPSKKKFAYSNKFFEDTARNLTKYEVVVWMYLWNFAFDKGGSLVAERSTRTLAHDLGMDHRNIDKSKNMLKAKGLLIHVGAGKNRTEIVSLIPVVTAPPTPRKGAGSQMAREHSSEGSQMA